MRFKEAEHTDVEVLQSKHGIVIADVRDKTSYDEAHIPHALHLSIEKLQEFCDQFAIASTGHKPLLTYIA